MDTEAYIRINEQRKAEYFAAYDPITGEGSDTCQRKPFHCADFDGERTKNGVLMIPAECFQEKIIQNIDACGSIVAYLENLHIQRSSTNKRICYEQYMKARAKYDFEYAAAKTMFIKDRNSNKDVPFVLNRAQRKLLKEIYVDDKAGKPIRAVILKGRQFGGSTLVQLFYGHKQIFVMGQWHSVIVAHIENTAKIIRGMYSKMLKKFPKCILGNTHDLSLLPFENSQKTRIVKEVGCRITIGSAEKPNGIVGDNISMAHFSEVGLYQKTDGKTPEELIQSIVSGISYMKDTAVIYESTARGVGNFFYKEWRRAVCGDSAFRPVFISWFDFDDNYMPVDDPHEFVRSMSLYEQEVFRLGATIEHLNWRRHKVKEYSDEWRFKMEFPSFPEEAFQSTGNRFYPAQDVERLRKGVCKPTFVGEIYGKANYGEEATKEIVFKEEHDGALKVWYMPESDRYSDRYVIVMDIGGTSDKADNSVICVLDRKEMSRGGVPIVVAEWCGHTDHDLLAWKAVQLATAYQNGLLIIESNTLEKEHTEGFHFEFIMDEIAYYYNNLYSRVSSDKLVQGVPPKWGFHTNKTSKYVVCDHQKKALRENLYIETCEEAVNEHDTFERKPDGTLGAIDGAHDDRHITRAIGVWACYEELSAPRKYKPMKQEVRKAALKNESSF